MSDPVVESIVPALCGRVRQLMRQQGVPGVALGIVRDQALVWSEGFGYADLASGRPLDEHVAFGVASITAPSHSDRPSGGVHRRQRPPSRRRPCCRLGDR
jgi:hypothetical protein